jgi:hypothetical protein
MLFAHYDIDALYHLLASSIYYSLVLGLGFSSYFWTLTLTLTALYDISKLLNTVMINSAGGRLDDLLNMFVTYFTG